MGAARLGDGKATAAGNSLSNGQEQQASKPESNPDSEEGSADDESALGNATGDEIVTDGKITVVQLATSERGCEIQVAAPDLLGSSV